MQTTAILVEATTYVLALTPIVANCRSEKPRAPVFFNIGLGGEGQGFATPVGWSRVGTMGLTVFFMPLRCRL